VAQQVRNFGGGVFRNNPLGNHPPQIITGISTISVTTPTSSISYLPMMPG
jgi:hypothetical protein